MHHRIPRSRGGTRKRPNLVEKPRRHHVAWHQIVRNMLAEEAISFISILWQCQSLQHTGCFVPIRGGIEMPISSIRINPLSFPAQQRAFEFLFGELGLTPEAMAWEIESWIDPFAQVRYVEQ